MRIVEWESRVTGGRGKESKERRKGLGEERGGRMRMSEKKKG
jgi:hypothetical protein